MCFKVRNSVISYCNHFLVLFAFSSKIINVSFLWFCPGCNTILVVLFCSSLDQRQNSHCWFCKRQIWEIRKISKQLKHFDAKNCQLPVYSCFAFCFYLPMVRSNSLCTFSAFSIHINPWQELRHFKRRLNFAGNSMIAIANWAPRKKKDIWAKKLTFGPFLTKSLFCESSLIKKKKEKKKGSKEKGKCAKRLHREWREIIRGVWLIISQDSLLIIANSASDKL